MSKKALIIAAAIGFVIVITGIIFTFGQKESSIQTGTQNAEEITVSILPNGWREVRHPAYGISLEVPLAWKITILENGRGKIEAALLGAGVSAVVDVFREENTKGSTPEKLLSENKNNRATEISKGSIRGASYVTKLGSEHINGFINDSYLLSAKYFLDNQILNVSCSLSGPNYKTMIPTCEKIVESLQFIE